MTSKLKVNLINDSGDNNIITSDGSGVITSSKFKIGQVVSTHTNATSFSTNSATMVDVTGMSVAITPSSTSSKILVMATVTCSGNNGGRFFIGFKRGSTAIGDGDASGSRIAGVTTGTEQVGGETIDSLSISFLDSPSSTSEQTYKLTGCAEGSNTFRLNRSPNDTDGTNTARGASTITVMEVLP